MLQLLPMTVDLKFTLESTPTTAEETFELYSGTIQSGALGDGMCRVNGRVPVTKGISTSKAPPRQAAQADTDAGKHNVLSHSGLPTITVLSLANIRSLE